LKKRIRPKKSAVTTQEGLCNKLYFVEQGIEEVITLKKGKGSKQWFFEMVISCLA
jgi:hypothetical protein